MAQTKLQRTRSLGGKISFRGTDRGKGEKKGERRGKERGKGGEKGRGKGKGFGALKLGVLLKFLLKI